MSSIRGQRRSTVEVLHQLRDGTQAPQRRRFGGLHVGKSSLMAARIRGPPSFQTFPPALSHPQSPQKKRETIFRECHPRDTSMSSPLSSIICNFLRLKIPETSYERLFVLSFLGSSVRFSVLRLDGQMAGWICKRRVEWLILSDRTVR